jgi:hypothetical protein
VPLQPARTWLAGVERDELSRVVPFMERKRRSMCALAVRLEPHLRWDIGEDPSYELWVYGDNRSCKLASYEETIACSFFIGQAQVAHAAAPDDVPEAVAVWLGPSTSVRQLAARVPMGQSGFANCQPGGRPCLRSRYHALRPRTRREGHRTNAGGLIVADGIRQCVVSDRYVTFTEPGRCRAVVYQTLDDAAREVRRYLEGGVSLDELAADPRV